MEQVFLPRPIVNQLLSHAQQQTPNEICGLIGAIDGQAKNCYRINNIADDAAHRYQMDPKQQIGAMKEMRDRGEELFAIYHSHPTAAAKPSSIDVAEANYTDVIYLIISLNTQGVLEMQGFRLVRGVVTEVMLVLS